MSVAELEAPVALGCPPPRFGTPRSPERATLGPAVGMVAAMLGKPFMPWQQHVADVVLEIDPDTGELAYSEWVLLTPRQSGKSTLILAKVVHRASATKFFGDRQQMVYTAQTRIRAKKKWREEYLGDLQRSRRFANRVVPVLTPGDEHMRFQNGSRFGIESGTDKSGHGDTLDEAYVDEAFAQPDNRLEQAFRPAMITRRNKQIAIVSTAGWSDQSIYLLQKVKTGRKLVEQGVRRGTAYFEWSAPDDAPAGAVETWLGCMPALHRPTCTPQCRDHRVSIAAVRAEYESAVQSDKLDDFRRAYLNQWRRRPREGADTVLGDWASRVLRGPDGEPVDPDELDMPAPGAIGIAVTDDREWASIGSAGSLPDGRRLVGAVDRQPGTSWLVDEAHRIQRTYGCAVVVDGRGEAVSLVRELREAGVNVHVTTTGEFLDACAGMVDGVRDKQVAHLAHEELDDSIDGAAWRSVGNRKAYDRRAGDVSMLEAVTLADWFVSAGEPPAVSVHFFDDLERCDVCEEELDRTVVPADEWICPDCRREDPAS